MDQKRQRIKANKDRPPSRW